MKNNFFKVAALTALSLVGFTATAQEEETTFKLPFELSGSVDANFTATQRNGANFERYGTSFFNTDGFSVGMVNLVASKQVGKVGFVADIAAGPTANEAISGSGTSAIVNQLFVAYAASDAVTLTFGRFNTFLGYEVISPTGNFNYTTSYMFSAGPFTHTGLKADFALSDEWSLMAALMNSTASPVDGNDQGKYTGGLQLGYSVDSGSAFLNVLYGRDGFNSEETFQIDLTTGWDLAEQFYLGVNATYNDTDGAGFYGAALYPQVALSDAFTLGLRGELFAEFVDVDGADDATVFATTLTGSYDIGALTIKPEIRLDSWSDDLEVFEIEPGEAAESSLFGFALGAIYSF